MEDEGLKERTDGRERKTEGGKESCIKRNRLGWRRQEGEARLGTPSLFSKYGGKLGQ